MNNVHAVATRHHSRITVFVGGQLADTCHSAQIIDWYPGGHRVYIVDPGAAQVFISEKIHPGPCLEVLVPWQGTIDILDEAHDEVQIFVNERKVLTVPVATPTTQYDVYRVLIEPLDHFVIIPDGHIVPAIYQKVFGPASYEDCVAYINSQGKGGTSKHAPSKKGGTSGTGPRLK